MLQMEYCTAASGREGMHLLQTDVGASRCRGWGMGSSMYDVRWEGWGMEVTIGGGQASDYADCTGVKVERRSKPGRGTYSEEVVRVSRVGSSFVSHDVW